MPDYAPIALFVYKRLDLTMQVVESLKRNNLAQNSRLYIFSDAAKSKADEEQIDKVRKYISSIDGFSEVTVISARENQGCAKSVISGVSKIFEQYEKIIVVEDDLILTPNFLDFMNSALDYYAAKNVFSICGYGMALNFEENDKTDVYYLPRGGSWGWATWKNLWEKVDWNVSDYSVFKNDPKARKKFNLGGTDLSRMLSYQMKGLIDSWAIRWWYAQSKMEMLTVYPKISKVENNGFGQNATHSANDPHFKVILDESNKTTFNFNEAIHIDPDLLTQFTYYFSVFYRIKNRLKHRNFRLPYRIKNLFKNN